MTTSLNVFLLDDELVLCEMVRRILTKRASLPISFTEVPSGSGHEALHIIEGMTTPPHLMFIDLRLNNGVSGFEVVDATIKKFKKDDIFIVILTGCWEGSGDWDKSIEYLRDGRVDTLIGKWGIGTVMTEIEAVIAKVEQNLSKEN